MNKIGNITAMAKKLAAELSSSGDGKPAAVDPGAPGWVGQVAMITGALAALAGFVTVYATKLTNQAIYESNQAVLSQTQASDAWAEYQADSIKAHMVEMDLLPSSPFSAADKAHMAKIDQDFRRRQPTIKQAALAKTAERDSHLNTGLSYLAKKDVLNYAGMAAQLGIALASVAALTHRRSIFYISALVAAVSAAITAYGMLF